MFEKTFLPFVYEEINRILGETVERKQNESCELKYETGKRDDDTSSRTEPEKEENERSSDAFIPHSNTFQVLQDPMDQCMKHYFEKLKSVSYGSFISLLFPLSLSLTIYHPLSLLEFFPSVRTRFFLISFRVRNFLTRIE